MSETLPTSEIAPFAMWNFTNLPAISATERLGRSLQVHRWCQKKLFITANSTATAVESR
jgi:hypothetical protein